MADRHTDIEDIVQQCVDRIEAGESVASCLRDYPAQAAELEPLLKAAVAVLAWPGPLQSATGRQAALERALASLDTPAAPKRALASRATPAAPTPAWHHWRPQAHLARRMLGTALALVVIFIALSGSVAAAQGSIPGDRLYGVKRASEKVRLQLAVSPTRQALLHLSLADRRAREILALRATGRPIVPSVVDDLARDYEQCWHSIARVREAARAALITQYEQVVRAHQQQLTAAVQNVESPADRSILEQAARVNADAIKRGAAPAPAQQITTATPGAATVLPGPTTPVPTPTSGPIGATPTAGLTATVGSTPPTVAVPTVPPGQTPEGTVTLPAATMTSPAPDATLSQSTTPTATSEPSTTSVPTMVSPSPSITSATLTYSAPDSAPPTTTSLVPSTLPTATQEVE